MNNKKKTSNLTPTYYNKKEHKEQHNIHTRKTCPTPKRDQRYNHTISKQAKRL